MGANGIMVFEGYFPLSLPGVIPGITMVFMPAVTTFVISRLLGGGQFTLIGNLLTAVPACQRLGFWFPDSLAMMG